MTDLSMNGTDSGIKDFTETRKVLQFRIGDDVFEAAASIPAHLGMRLAKMKDASEQDQFTAIGDFLDDLLFPASAERFAERMKDPQEPISINQVAEIFKWLMEQYTDRPTQPPSSSAGSQGTTGPTSTAGARPIAEASIR